MVLRAISQNHSALPLAVKKSHRNVLIQAVPNFVPLLGMQGASSVSVERRSREHKALLRAALGHTEAYQRILLKSPVPQLTCKGSQVQVLVRPPQILQATSTLLLRVCSRPNVTNLTGQSAGESISPHQQVSISKLMTAFMLQLLVTGIDEL
jgi:hypothetical protein